MAKYFNEGNNQHGLVLVHDRLTQLVLAALMQNGWEGLRLALAKPSNEVEKTIYKIYRLRHHRAGRRNSTHIIGYIGFSGDGKLAGIFREDNKEVEQQVDMLNGQPWLTFPCSHGKCRGAFRIRAKPGQIMLLQGIVESCPELGNPAWQTCQAIAGCDII